MNGLWEWLYIAHLFSRDTNHDLFNKHFHRRNVSVPEFERPGWNVPFDKTQGIDVRRNKCKGNMRRDTPIGRR